MSWDVASLYSDAVWEVGIAIIVLILSRLLPSLKEYANYIALVIVALVIAIFAYPNLDGGYQNLLYGLVLVLSIVLGYRVAGIKGVLIGAAIVCSIWFLSIAISSFSLPTLSDTTIISVLVFVAIAAVVFVGANILDDRKRKKRWEDERIREERREEMIRAHTHDPDRTYSEDDDYKNSRGRPLLLRTGSTPSS